MIETVRLVTEYLKSLGAVVTESSDKAAAFLTEELDRKFMNRPFYWHYRDAQQQPGAPMQIILTSTPGLVQHKDIIQLHPDHPIFEAMLEAAQVDNRFYTVYAHTEEVTELFPWISLHLTAETVPPKSATIRLNGCISLTTGCIKINDAEHPLTAIRPDGSIIKKQAAF